MKIIFAGTPHFAAMALETLLAHQFAVTAVLTQPDRPAGRGMQLMPGPVKQLALQHGLTVLQPRSLKDADIQRELAAYDADLMVVAAYGLILPQAVLQLPRYGCLNIHASLLPRWRGAAPIQRAILAGDTETGITIMQMDAGLDTGNMLLAHTTEILPGDTAGSLQERLAVLGARLMLLALQVADANALKPIVQPLEGVTYAHKIDKAEAAIDWTQSAAVIARRVRAFNPAPGASAVLQGETLKIWRAQALAHSAPAGVATGSIVAVSDEGIAVAALDSTLLITELQRPGGKRLSMADFLRGFELHPGMAFEKSLH